MKIQTLMMLAFGLAVSACAIKSTEDKVNDIDRLLGHYQHLNKFSGAVLVSHGGDILLASGYGYRNSEQNILHDTSSVFQIYSITKTFTSTMIFMLIEQKKLSLDDRLSKFYPSFPNGEQITIEHLLTHTSGINDDLGPDATETENFRVSMFGKNKPLFPPGAGWSYSNGGYQLLGYIIQKVTGEPYEHAIRRNIFTPLNMTKSGFDFKGLSNTAKATGYSTYNDEKKEAAILYDSAGPFSAGSMYSTIGDLYKYYKSFQSHQLLNSSSQRLAFTASTTNDGYGHGWQIADGLLKRKMIFHGGGAAGFRTNFAMIPEDDICIILLSNHENASPDFLTRRITKLLDNERLHLESEVKLSEPDLKKLVGAYSFKEPVKMMIYTSIVDGRLAIQVSGQQKTTVLAKNENTFVHEEADATLKFTTDETDGIPKMHVVQGSRTLTGERIESHWGVIGDATTKGWDETSPDIKFSELNDQRGVWVIKNVELKNGEIKFRLNDDWNINYGDNETDGVLDSHGKNIKVEAGIYDITLDLRDQSMEKYSVIKQAK